MSVKEMIPAVGYSVAMAFNMTEAISIRRKADPEVTQVTHRLLLDESSLKDHEQKMEK